MTITKQRFTCKYRHVFEADVVTAAPFTVAIASLQSVRCPKCGSHEVGFGGSYDDTPPATATIEQRAAWWRERGEIGTSSLTIWCAFTDGQTPHRDYLYPLDPDDFRRCRKLLDLIPEWRARLHYVTRRFPWFQPFADRWDEFDALYVAESATGRCGKLYNAMKVACREADKIREAGV